MPSRFVLRPPAYRQADAACRACQEPPVRALHCPRCGDLSCLVCALAEPACSGCGEDLGQLLEFATSHGRTPAERGVRAWCRAWLVACWTRLAREAQELARGWSSESGRQMSFPVVLFGAALVVSLPLWALLSRWLAG